VSEKTVEQVIRPTGLIDPEMVVRGVTARSANSEGPHARKNVKEGEDGGARAKRSPGSVLGSVQTYSGQINDFIEEAIAVVKKDERVMVTTLTKKMAEDLSIYLKEKGVKSEYLHSDVKTIERIKILTEFRKGTFDCLVGVNLLREGLDLPEVSLVAILDADKEGFLRSETSLIQTIGRAARHISGRVLLYADVMTKSLTAAIGETNRRRGVQLAYNDAHGITPISIKKKIHDITEEMENVHDKTLKEMFLLDKKQFEKDPNKLIKQKEKQMKAAVKELDFETAALLRDEIQILKGEPVKAKSVRRSRK
jgi:excinuclease ABC subunit B